jgi:sarcosine oxidase subunit beta
MRLERENEVMAKRYDVIVVGCGIAGSSLAFFLSKRGLRVLILERKKPASGGTGFSAAIVRQHYSTALMARLAFRSVEIFQDAPRQLGRDAGYKKTGYLFLAPPPSAAITKQNVAMQRAIGIDTCFIDDRELGRRYPWLNLDGVAGAAYEADGGYADPKIATTAFVDAAVENGAELKIGTPVRGLLKNGDRVEGVTLDDHEILADWVVNAAGPWSKALAASAGIEMTMRTVREQDTVWEARGERPLPDQVISNSVDAIYIRPLGQRRYVVGRGFPKEYVDVDPYNYKETADADFIDDVQTRMTTRIPPFAGAKLINSYAALYDVTADWYQYVGPRKGLLGYADFCGGSGHGFKVAPGIAEELAKWIALGEVAADFNRLSFDRVKNDDLFVGAYGGNRG